MIALEPNLFMSVLEEARSPIYHSNFNTTEKETRMAALDRAAADDDDEHRALNHSITSVAAGTPSTSPSHRTTKAPRANAPPKRTKRQLKHREAMARFRQRKRARLADLEQEEAQLQHSLESLLARFDGVQHRPTAGASWSIRLDPRERLQQEYTSLVIEMEALLLENETLEIELEEKAKYQALVRRACERQVDEGIWRCV